jgi:hypothetical protein
VQTIFSSSQDFCCSDILLNSSGIPVNVYQQFDSICLMTETKVFSCNTNLMCL